MQGLFVRIPVPFTLDFRHVGPETLYKLIEEARIICSDINQATSWYDKLSSDTSKIQSDLDGRKPLVSSAVN
jgi:hypothetical protein